MKMERQLRKQRQLNNEGFSLVELIVVIAIMGVLIAIAIATSSVLESSRVRDAEQGISDYVTLARTKSMSVAAKDWYMVITKENDDYKAQIYKTVAEEDNITTTQVYEHALGKKVTVYYSDARAELDAATAISAENELMIYYNPSTGRVKQVLLGTNDNDSTNDESMDITAGMGYIKITSGSYETVVKVFLNTGKCEKE